jgi:hypothetical protein
MSPTEAAAQLAEDGCDIMFDCGLYDIECDPPEVTHHDASEYYDSREACVAEIAPFYIEIFQGCAAANLSEAEKDALNDCLNSSRSCPSQSDIDDAIDQACNNAPPADTACQRAEGVLDRCFTCANDPEAC